MKTKFVFFLLLFFICSLSASAQEIVTDEELKQDLNFLVYKRETNEKFTGISQKIRTNGHVVYEEKFEDGVILERIVYFNQSNKEISQKTIFNKSKPYVPLKIVKYGSNEEDNCEEIIHLNEMGKKVLKETITNGRVTYRCQYQNGKKHGLEYCILKDGSELTVKYNQGKKIE